MQDWVAVIYGSLAEVELGRSRLEAAGIPCLVPAMNMKTIDPFQTGGLIFDYQLLVPRSALDVVRTTLEDSEGELEPLADEVELPADFFAPEPASPRVRAIAETCATLSRRIRWGAASFVGAPFALAEFIQYLRAVEQLGSKPPHHRATLVAFGLSVVEILGLAYIVAIWN